MTLVTALALLWLLMASFYKEQEEFTSHLSCVEDDTFKPLKEKTFYEVKGK